MMTQAYPQLELDAQLCLPLHAATRAVTRAYGHLLAEEGLTYPQYLTMLAVWDAAEPVTVGEIGERLRLDSGTLTPLLKRLEAAGLVERRRDPGDERRVLISPTPGGVALRDRVAGVPLRLASALALDEEDTLALRSLLAKAMRHLDAFEATLSHGA